MKRLIDDDEKWTFNAYKYQTKIPVVGYLSGWHHTYVVAVSATKMVAFGCGGGNDNGMQFLPSFYGSIVDAQKIATLDKSYGIIWGVTGYCHQIANRVLYACVNHPTVAGVEGSNASYFIYGPYGFGWAEHLQDVGL